jgi:UDP-glucose 4-epimerase
MKILLMGAAGFIGTNLAIRLAENQDNHITLVDKNRLYFNEIEKLDLKNISIYEAAFDEGANFDQLLREQEIVYHLISTTVPTTSNQHIPQELIANVIATSNFLEACVRCNIKKVVFISSGGTVYGKESNCPLTEDTPTNPITSYGIQKITIEKLLYLYQYMYGLDYRVIRLANPYGPYQRPNGILGAVTTFTYKALKNEEITVYGDGSVVRDFIYIDDAVKAMMYIVNGESKHRVYNLGCGYGTSIKQLLEIIHEVLGLNLNIKYQSGRTVDVPINYLDISRYENDFEKLNPIALHEGVQKTANFMINHYII